LENKDTYNKVQGINTPETSKMYIKFLGEKIMKKLIAIIFAVILMAAAVVGCTPATNDTSSETVDPQTKLNTILADVKKAYESDAEYYAFITDPNYFSALDVDMFADMYMVDKANIEALTAEMCGMITSIDRFIGIKAVEGKGEEVATAVKTFHENSKANLAWYPQNVAKTETAQVIVHGDYVFYVIMGSNPAVDAELDEAAALAFAEAEMKKAVDVINAAF